MINKKFKILKYLSIIIFICFLAAPSFITSSFLSNLEVKEESMNLYPSVFELDEDDKNWIENQLNRLSLHEKAAQMVTIQIPANSTSTSPEFKK
jgi:hypothetical protein